MDRKFAEQQYKSLYDEAQSWKSAWRSISTYIAPTCGLFDEDPPNRGKTIDHETIVDGHASRALDTLASGMTSGLTSPSRPWFKLGVPDPDLADYDAVKYWLDAVQASMMSVFSKSNIYGVLNSIYKEVGGFGTGAMILLEDYKEIIRGRNFTIGEYYLATGPDCRVNTFARKFHYTVSQLVKEFGLENVSDPVKVAYQNGDYNNWVKVRHLILPNYSYESNSLGPRGKEYSSVYWEVGSEETKFLKTSGFNGFPILAPRWNTTTTSDVYGRSPGWNALGDVKMLQKMQADKLAGLDRVVDPPVVADAGFENVNLLPGGLNRSSASVPGATVKSVYDIRPDFAAIENSIAQTKQAISQSFFTDLFLMISQSDGPRMTAREVVERHEEKLLMLGPVLERLENELLDPLIDRTFNIMLNVGMIPPPPDELQGMELKVEYISVLAQAQKMVGTTAIEQTMAFAGNLAGAFPQILDVVDPDEAIMEYAEMNGVPPKIIRPKEEIARIRKEKADAAAQQQAMANAGAMVQGAKVLSDTKIGQNSALDALVGAPGQ